MTPCNFNGCTDSATHAIKLCVPCVGQSLAQHKPVELILGLLLCHAHAANADVRNFFEPRPSLLGLAHPPSPSPLLDIFVHAARSQGREPDIDRAFIAPISFESQEWQEFQMAQHGAPKGSA